MFYISIDKIHMFGKSGNAVTFRVIVYQSNNKLLLTIICLTICK